MTDKLIPASVSPANGTDDREACRRYWIAAYTRPRSEKKAAMELETLGVEIYLPIQKQKRQWSDRKKLVDVVVVPMIIFLKVSDNDIQKIIKHPLIIRPLSIPGEKHPAVIPLVQIEKLKFILGQSDFSVTYEPSIFKVNDVVRVIRGKLIGVTGEIYEDPNGTTELTVHIGILGGAKLKISKTDLELIV